MTPTQHRYTRIAGTGSHLPPRRVTNAELVEELAQRGIETSHEWIVERTGIHARHFVAGDVCASDMAADAARAAIAAAGCSASDIDLIIVATSTPDMVFPSTACILQHKLGIAPSCRQSATSNRVCALYLTILSRPHDRWARPRDNCFGRSKCR